jgi:phage terminase large subunit
MAKPQTRPIVEVRFPPKLKFLFQPCRYKIIHGGRGGGKSWSVARALLTLGTQSPIRVLCAREFQASIADSVHRLLTDQIDNLGLTSFYTIEKATIFAANGTEFRFAGISNNVQAIKSYEGITHCWCEEAENIRKRSWETLIPTIRLAGSEIWVTFNAQLETDETYRRFVAEPPPNSVVTKLNWSDNPWFPDVLREEMELLRERDEDAWLNVWEGHPRQNLDGAIYAKELRAATEDGRVCRVPYDATKPVHTFWDLGWADNTSIWLAQVVGFEYRVIDHISGSQKPLNAYLGELQAKGYIYGTDWLPHDAKAKQLGTGRSVEELMRAAGRTVRIVPHLSVEDGINAARTVFANCWFDQERCADGLQSLRHYRYEMDERAGTLKRVPLHDFASHDADAFRYLAVALKNPVVPLPRPVREPWEYAHPNPPGTDWMRM